MERESTMNIHGFSEPGSRPGPLASSDLESGRSPLAAVARCLLRDWTSNWRCFGLPMSLWKLLRSLQAFLSPAEHARLSRLDIYRNYLSMSDGENYYHHLTYRHYLAKGLTFRQRVGFALTHYEFEAGRFSGDYKRRVYSRRGLTMWEKQEAGAHFRLSLSVAWRIPPEGDLCAALFIDGQRLHSMNFSWVSDPETGQIVPYIVRNQGRWPHDPERLMHFEQAFPHNSPRYFCLAAIQGIARAVGADRMLAVSSVLQTCHTPEHDQRFAASYNAFWASMGGTEIPAWGYGIPVPFFSKPLTDVPTKHRKRAKMRRDHWTEIEQSTEAAIEACLIKRTHYLAIPEDSPNASTRQPAPATRPADTRELASHEPA